MTKERNLDLRRTAEKLRQENPNMTRKQFSAKMHEETKIRTALRLALNEKKIEHEIKFPLGRREGSFAPIGTGYKKRKKKSKNAVKKQSVKKIDIAENKSAISSLKNFLKNL